jgi:hypothetical protein
MLIAAAMDALRYINPELAPPWLLRACLWREKRVSRRAIMKRIEA